MTASPELHGILIAKPKNEKDVCETIIRPLLHDLGYRQGTTANIDTEVTLKYGRQFLGRKKRSDPPLEGRADYICTVVGVASWVVEAKSPQDPLTSEDIEQAHSYARHPTINGQYLLLTNGLDIWLYQASNLSNPLVAFKIQELPEWFSPLHAVLSPAAIQERFIRPFSPSEEILKNIGSGIGRGVGPQARISGGFVAYTHFEAEAEDTNRLLGQLIGNRSAVVDGAAYRLPNGMIQANVKVAQSNTRFDALAKLMNLEWFTFACAEEYLSSDPMNPTALSGQQLGTIPAGSDLSSLPGALPGTRLPFPVHFACDIHVAGVLEADKFKGQLWYRITYAVDLDLVAPQFHAVLLQKMQDAMHIMWGEFEVVFVPVAQADLPKHFPPAS